MRDAEKTIGNLIDKQGVSFIASTDGNGFPNFVVKYTNSHFACHICGLQG